MIAYLESGGFIIPFLVSALVGISVAVRVYWGKITGFFSRWRDKGE